MNSKKTTAIIYAFYNRPDARNNLTFFFQNGYIDVNVDYFVVVNEDATQFNSRTQILDLIPKRSNISIYFQENKGYDFAGYLRGIDEANRIQSYDYYFFLNASLINDSAY